MPVLEETLLEDQLLEEQVLEEPAVDTEAEARRRALIEELRDEIEVEAYYLWQKRGSPRGDDLTDWLAAQEKLVAEANGRSPARNRR